jgi:cytochrome c oxidase assembly protein subunit 15
LLLEIGRNRLTYDREVKTPLGWAASRWTLGPRALRWGTTAALVVSILIVLGGGFVRVTGSGLGCPTWPSCDGTSLTPIPALGIHAVIEFANRTLTGLLVAAVGWAIIAARLQKPVDRTLTRLAWSMFWLVVINAVAGGITVLVKLNPWVVALHFVLAIGLLATATFTWHRARASTPVGSPRPPAVPIARVLTVATLALVVVGTIVSGAGPHSGDSADVPRITTPPWGTIVWVHTALAVIVILLAIALLIVVWRDPAGLMSRRRTIAFLIVLLAQGVIGGIQALNGLPELLVALHVLGAALVWVGALRVLLDTDTRLFRSASL